MRVTSQMMNNNSLANINMNKEELDKLNNKQASGKKVTRPSDDPVIAIRALKLRKNVSDITQYYERNTSDAGAWLTATQDAIESNKTILTSMRAEINKGATGTNSLESRAAIAQELKALKDQIYANADADYEGRTIFTGYKTNSKVTFSKDQTLEYQQITENFTATSVETFSYIYGKLDLNVDSEIAASKQEQSVDCQDVTRIRLAYDDLDTTGLNITLNIAGTVTPSIASKSDAAYISVGPDDAVLIPETGELILGSALADAIRNSTAEPVISVSYNKSSWKAGNLMPENFFDCRKESGVDALGVKEFTTYTDANKQKIDLDVSTNQTLTVNCTASEVFDTGIGRDVSELIAVIGEVDEAEDKVNKLKSKLAEDPDNADIKNALDAANKEYDLVSDKLQKTYESYLTRFDSYLNKVVLAGTQVGTKLERLELVKNRLMSLQTTAKELRDNNENVEISDITIEVSEAELTYNAALMAAGTLSQQSLLSYI